MIDITINCETVSEEERYQRQRENLENFLEGVCYFYNVERESLACKIQDSWIVFTKNEEMGETELYQNTDNLIKMLIEINCFEHELRIVNNNQIKMDIEIKV